MPTEYYDAPYLDESEHLVLDHTGIPGVGGGGGGLAPTDYLQISGSPPNPLDHIVTVVTLDPDNLGGAGYVSRGNAITWAPEQPSRVTINSAGLYDVRVLAQTAPGGTFASSISSYFYVNGSLNYSDGAWIETQTRPTGNDTISVGITVLGRQFSAGDYLEVVISDNGNSSSDTGFGYAFVAVTKRT